MAKTMSSSLLAKSNFLAGVQEELIAIDVYGKNDAGVVNKIQDVAQLFDVDLTNILKGGEFIEKEFPIIEDVSEGLLKINKDNLSTRIAGLSSTIGSALQNVKEGVENQLENVKALGDVYTKVSGVVTKVKNTDFSNLKDVSTLISDVTGNSRLLEVVDRAAETALYVGVIKEAASKGIPNALSAVVDGIENVEVLNNVIKNILPTTIETSDIRMLASAVEADVSKVMNLVDKNFISKFTANYEFGTGFNENEEIKAFSLLKDTLDAVDSFWSKKQIIEDGITTAVSDISKIIKSSNDFKDGLIGYIKDTETLETEDKLLSLALVYDQESVDQALAQYFPFNVRSDLDANSSNPASPLIT